MAVNSREETFVSEYGLVERVQGFRRDGRKLQIIFGNAGSGPGEFNRAEGLGIDSADRIYVADSCNHRIQIFSPDGKWLRGYGKAGSSKGELSYPYDVRVDASGFQFVCEFGNSRIQIFDAHDQPVEILGGAGAEPGQFNNPWSIALDSRGNLYVADSGNHRVQKFLRKSSVVSSQLSVDDGSAPLRADENRAIARPAILVGRASSRAGSSVASPHPTSTTSEDHGRRATDRKAK